MPGFFLGLIALLVASAMAAALLARSDRAARAASTTGTLIACAIGVTASVKALLDGTRTSLRFAGRLPVGELHFGVDPLTSFFLLCIFLVSGLAVAYGAGYLGTFVGRRRLAPALVFLPLLVAGMIGVVLARDGILLIVAWEIMSVASFFLVTFEHDRAEVRRAGTLYLMASQLGVVLLFVLFAVLGRAAGSYDFERLGAMVLAPRLAGLAFLLAVAGFGTKAGFWPLHVWLPDAHPAAPTHVSALMSGVMIKLGIYGVLRMVLLLGPPAPWWGAVMIGVGATSGVAGMLLALAQRDLKRLLAYSSVENIGIVALGIGVGLLGQAAGASSVAFLGYGGALLHVLNHGLFKGLLFQAAGSVQHGAGTRDLESLGGLARGMPATTALFLVGAVAICGLPPLNGLIGEWLIYRGAFQGGAALSGLGTTFAIAAVVALALIGGLALACFVRAFGVVFLGSARGPGAAHAHESGLAMRLPMFLGAALCLAIGVWPAWALHLIAAPAADLARLAGAVPRDLPGLIAMSRALLMLIALVALLALARNALLARRPVRQAATWGCGYEAPTPRMQYSAASFAQPLLEPFAIAVSARLDRAGPEGYFPTAAHYRRHVGDMAGERMLEPATRRLLRVFEGARGLQHGRLQLYLAYILVTLIVLLVWQLWGFGRPLMHAEDWIPIGLLLLLPPLLPGVIARVKSWFAGRTGPPLFQLYFDLVKLARKGAVYSRTTTVLFRAGPMISLACVLLAGLIVPLAGVRAPFGFEGDVVLFATLLALGRFFTLTAALDTGSSFEGMGASRDAAFAALSEPTVFLVLAIACLPAGSASFAHAWTSIALGTPGLSRAPLLAAAAALFAVYLAENARIPVDDPGTHLELTMVHEVQVLDHGGPDLAMVLYGSALKLFVLGALLVHLVLPAAAHRSWPGVAWLVGGELALAVAVGVVESGMARLRLSRVPQFLIGAFAIAAVGLAAITFRVGR